MTRSKTLLFLNLLWAFTIVYFCIGKFQWIIPSYFLVITFVVISFLAINIGYFTVPHALRVKTQTELVSLDMSEVFHKYRILFAACCVLTIAFQVLWVVTFLGKFSFLSAFEMIGENYFERMEVEFEDTNALMRVRTLFWIVTYFVYPIGFMFFKHMPFRYKLLFIATVIIEVFASLNMGVSKNIGDLALIYILILLFKAASTSCLAARKRATAKKREFLIKIVLILVVFLIAFSLIQSQRDSASQTVDNPFEGFAHVRNVSLFDFFFGKNTPITNTLDKMGYYISHGYAGLAYAMEIPFESTYGLGFSNSLLEYAGQYFDLPSSVRQATYNFRLQSQFGWQDGKWWSTSFVRIANAVSFWLVPLVMFLFGRLFGSAERRWQAEGDVISLILCCQLFIGFVYASCNLQIFQGRQALIATFLLLGIYFVRNTLRIRFRWR